MWILYIILFISLWNCNSPKPDSGFLLEGKWKDIKSDDVYEKNRKEVLFDIHRVGEDYSGQVLSLDNAIESNGEIRKCNKCLNASGNRMLLGFPILQNIKQTPDGKKFTGRMYDIQQRKWFDADITPEGQDRIRIRVYAKIPLFGKTFVWERGEEYYKKLLTSESNVVSKIPRKGIYAMTLGEIDMKTETEVILKSNENTKFQTGKRVYFYNKTGKKSAVGDFIENAQGQIKIKLIEKDREFITEPSTAVIFL